MQCRDGVLSRYQLCEFGILDVQKCEECDGKRKCIDHVEIWRLHNVFGRNPNRGFGVKFSIKMIFETTEKAAFEYTENYFSLQILQNCTKRNPCLTIDNEMRETCDPMENDKVQLRRPTCVFPNPFLGTCHKVHCKLTEPHASSFKNNSDRRLEYFLSEYLLLLSIISLVITVLLFLFIPELRTSFSYYQINCYMTYLVSNLFLFISAGVGSVRVPCILSAVFLHFALLSSFMWMMVTGGFIMKRFHMLNRQIANAIIHGSTINKKHTLAHFLGHCLPAAFVLGCVVCDFWLIPGQISYGTAQFCWINSQRSLLRVFVIPSGILLALNVFIFVACFLCLIHFRLRNQSVSRHSYMVFVLVKLLIGSGVQWLLGVVVHFYPEEKILLYIFIVLVSAHGILILVCTLSQRVVRRFMANICWSTHDKIKTSVLRRTVAQAAGPALPPSAG